MEAQNSSVAETELKQPETEFEDVFQANYEFVARVVFRIIHDPGRAEEIAVDAFLNWKRSAPAQGIPPRAWLCRAAARMALDELRKRIRRHQFDRLLAIVMARSSPTPEEIHRVTQEQDRVRSVLAAMRPLYAELLFLRSQGLDYGELASAMKLNRVSVGTLLSRAQRAFRKEYVDRYGEQ